MWPASPSYILELEEKSKGQSSILDGKASVSGSSFQHILAIATDQSTLSIHEQGRYLKYESYFMQTTCMIFFDLCLANLMLSYSVVHTGLVLLVAKSHTPFTN